MRTRFIDRRRRTGLLAAASAVTLAASCSGAAPEQVEASQASPEPTIESPLSSEPTEEPTASEESDPVPTIGEDEPLYAPLPELTPDPENDVPDDLEQLILDAAATAIAVEAQAYAVAGVDEETITRSHVREAEESVRSWVESLREQGLVERTPDTEFTRVFIREFDAGLAIVRECFSPGPRSGMYDAEAGTLVEPAPDGMYARDRLLEILGAAGEQPTYRVVQVEYSDAEGCEG